MKENFILKAGGIAIAIALGILATPSMAQDNASSTMDTPSRSGSGYEDLWQYSQPLDGRSWGNHPRSQYRQKQQPITLGAQGPMRSDSGEAQGSYWDKTKSYFRQPVGNRGEAGFLNWREANTDSP